MSLSLRTVDLGMVKNFAVVSDVHLRRPSDERTRFFIEALDECRDCDHIFFLGDIFDFIFIASSFFSRHWNDVFSKLETLASVGTKLVFIEGNHDFGFEHFAPKRFRDLFVAHGDIEVRANHPSLGSIVLRHGDDIVCQKQYLKFRSVVKSRALQSLTRALPGAALDRLFLIWASLSRKRNDDYALSETFLRQTVKAYLSSTREAPNYLVLGHVHIHAHTVIDETTLCIGPDWLTHPNILFCSEDGKIERRYLTGSGPQARFVG